MHRPEGHYNCFVSNEGAIGYNSGKEKRHGKVPDHYYMETAPSDDMHRRQIARRERGGRKERAMKKRREWRPGAAQKTATILRSYLRALSVKNMK